MSSSITNASVSIPWGRLEPPIPLEWPQGWAAPEVFLPNLAGAIDDYEAALKHALASPLGGRTLAQELGEGKKVAIVVDDPSRWTPVSDVLSVILEDLRVAGVRKEDISISAGVGRHLAVDREAMRKRVGEEIERSYSCYSPPVDDLSQYVDLGTSASGIPVRVFRPVAEADARILIGSVLPHLQAGFGGGYKLIFPGTSHRSTLGALHRSGLGEGDAGRLLGGDSQHNPMRKAIREAAALLPGKCFSISHLLGDPGQVFHIAAGDVDLVQDQLAREVQSRYQAPNAPEVDLVVAGNDPWPGDPMQSFKVLLNHRSACRKNGVLVGFFWTDANEIDRSFPLGPMKAIAATGAVGGWVARHGLTVADRVVSASNSSAAFMVRWARELVVDRAVMVYSPLLRDRLGPRLGPIRIFDRQEPLWRAVAAALGHPPGGPTARVFPKGGTDVLPEMMASQAKAIVTRDPTPISYHPIPGEFERMGFGGKTLDVSGTFALLAIVEVREEMEIG